MACSIIGLLGFAAASQHPSSNVATFEAYAADGTLLWSVENDIDGVPQFIEDMVLFQVRGAPAMLTTQGEVVPHRAPLPSGDVTTAGDLTFISQRSNTDRVLIVRDAAGNELWREEGARLIDAADPIAAFGVGSGFQVVAGRTGELLHEADPQRNRHPVAGPGAVAFTEANRLTVITLAKTTTFTVEGLPRGARVVKVDDGAVVTEEATNGSRLLRGFDQETGEELWSGFINGYSYMTAVFSGYSTPVELNARTGSAGGVWTDVAGPGGESASLATVLQHATDSDIRYLQHGAATMAVDAPTGRVLWADDVGSLMSAADGTALFNRGDSFGLVESATGRLLTSVPRTKRSTAASAAGRLLISDGTDVILVDRFGEQKVLASFKRTARVKAVNDRYGVIVLLKKSGKRLIVLDLASGDRVINQRIQSVARAQFEGDTLHLLQNSTRETTIDMTSAEVVRVGEPRALTARRAPPMKIAAVFDAARERILWEKPLGSQSTAGVMGDMVIVVRVGFRDGRNVEYMDAIAADG